MLANNFSPQINRSDDNTLHWFWQSYISLQLLNCCILDYIWKSLVHLPIIEKNHIPFRGSISFGFVNFVCFSCRRSLDFCNFIGIFVLQRKQNFIFLNKHARFCKDILNNKIAVNLNGDLYDTHFSRLIVLSFGWNQVLVCFFYEFQLSINFQEEIFNCFEFLRAPK